MRSVRTRARAHASRLKRLVYFSDTHIWHQLDARDLDIAPSLPPGFELRRARLEDVDLLTRLPAVVAPDGIVDAALARRRIEEGAVLWFVLAGDAPVAAVWTFSARAPAVAGPGGWLPLPPHSISIEDAIMLPERRGEGIIPAGVGDASRALAAEGVTRILMQAHVRNTSSQGAIKRFGARPVAEISLRRLGPIRRVRVRPAGDGVAAFFAARLERR